MDAMVSFRKSLEMDPEQPDVLVNLANLYASEGNHRDAIKVHILFVKKTEIIVRQFYFVLRLYLSCLVISRGLGASTRGCTVLA